MKKELKHDDVAICHGSCMRKPSPSSLEEMRSCPRPIGVKHWSVGDADPSMMRRFVELVRSQMVRRI